MCRCELLLSQSWSCAENVCVCVCVSGPLLKMHSGNAVLSPRNSKENKSIRRNEICIAVSCLLFLLWLRADEQT